MLKQLEDGSTANNPIKSLVSLCWDKREIVPSNVLVRCPRCDSVVTIMEAKYYSPNKKEKFLVIAGHIYADMAMAAHIAEYHTGVLFDHVMEVKKLILRYKITVSTSRVLSFLASCTSDREFIDKLGTHLYSAYCESVRAVLKK